MPSPDEREVDYGRELSRELDFEEILFRQIERILRAQTSDVKSFEKAVEGLAILLSPYKDEKFEQAERERLEWFMKEAEASKSEMTGKIPVEKYVKLKYDNAVKKFTNLMLLSGRNNFTPMKSDTIIIGESSEPEPEIDEIIEKEVEAVKEYREELKKKIEELEKQKQELEKKMQETEEKPDEETGGIKVSKVNL